MLSRLCTFITLTAACALPLQAGAQDSATKASRRAVSAVVFVPFSLVYVSAAASNAYSLRDAKRWKVTQAQPKGDKTALELHSDDKRMKLDMEIETQVAQAQRVEVGDSIDIDAIGNTGYAVRKGEATIALLAEPAAGATHSAVRG